MKMRAVILGLAGLVVAGNASAADFLRGSYDAPTPRYDWAGLYIGGQAGFANGSFGFSKAAQPLVADMVRATLVESEANISTLSQLPRGSDSGSTYGGFVGYNSQWGEAVVGAELNYNHLSLSAASNDQIGRTFTTSDGYTNFVGISTAASARVTDYMELRGRVGYASGWLMPFASAGVVAGRVNYTRDATIGLTEEDLSGATPPKPTLQLCSPGDTACSTRHDEKNGLITFGYSLGLGVDIGLFPGVFVRGEWEYVQFNSVANIPIQLQNFRVAAAVKF